MDRKPIKVIKLIKVESAANTLGAGIDMGSGHTELFSLEIQTCVVTDKGLDIHFTTVRNVLSFSCICMKCDRLFLTKLALQSHMKTHLESNMNLSNSTSNMNLSNSTKGVKVLESLVSERKDLCRPTHINGADGDNGATGFNDGAGEDNDGANKDGAEDELELENDVVTVDHDYSVAIGDDDNADNDNGDGTDEDNHCAPIMDNLLLSVSKNDTFRENSHSIETSTYILKQNENTQESGVVSGTTKTQSSLDSDDLSQDVDQHLLIEREVTVSGSCTTIESPQDTGNPSQRELIELTETQQTQNRPDNSKTGRKNTRIVCDVCGKRINGKEKYIEHMKAHNGERPYVCSMCGHGFVLKKRFESHLKKHELGKIREFYTCDECGKQVRTVESLRQHRLIHTGEKSHLCNLCGKTFRLKQAMKEHMRYHTGEKPHVCNICGKAFIKKSILNAHIADRHQEKILCSLCGKTLQNRHSLAIHIDVIHKEIRSICNLCGKPFKGKNSLRKHLLRHTGERQLSCSVCDEKFNVKVDLENHMRKHTGEKPFICSHCGHAFRIRSSLLRHLKTVHQETKPRIHVQTDSYVPHYQNEYVFSYDDVEELTVVTSEDV